MSNVIETIWWTPDPKPSLAIRETNERLFELDANLWARASQTLQVDSGASYRALIRESDFSAWWAAKSGGRAPGIRRFALRASSQWARPWEGMIAALDRSLWEQISLVRQTADNAATVHACEFEEPLQVLCLNGADSGDGLSKLDLDAEFCTLIAAYDGIDLTARTSISKPVRATAEKSNLASLLLQHRPAVLWYSGHASSDPPGLLFHDNTWMTPDELAETIQEVSRKGGRIPLYVILWACKTASAERFAAPAAAPPFIDALAKIGVAALIGSQAPLSDAAAKRIAGRLFSALAAGRPLDHGVAYARGELMRYAGEKLLRDADWLCPVVWCHGSFPETLHWSDGREIGVRIQDLGRKLLPPSLANVAFLDQFADQPPPSWPEHPRIWVSSRAAASVSSQQPWIQRVVARQKRSERTTLCFLFDAARPFHSVLADWAKSALEKIEHDDDRDGSIRTSAQELLEDVEQGWRVLCANRQFLLALIAPPEEAASWFWEAVQQDGGAQTIVLAEDFLTRRAQEGWVLDSLTANMTELPTRNLDFLAALSVLRQPANRNDVDAAASELTQKDSSQNLVEDWEGWLESSLVLETDAGCVVPAGIAERVIAHLNDDSRMRAHKLAFSFLNGPNARRKIEESAPEELLEARWFHADNGGLREAALNNGSELLDLFYRERRTPAFLGLFEHLKVEQKELQDFTIIEAAWALLDTGKSDEAQSWLSTREPDALAPLDAAFWFATQAEIQKSSGKAGSKEEAAEFLNLALEQLKDDTSDCAKRRQLSIRNDLARLIHFFQRKPAEAAPLFERILSEWEAIPYSDLHRAIVCRNLAEARMDMGNLPEAERRTVQARKLIPAWTNHPICSEVEYLSGRIAIRSKLDQEAIQSKFELCRKKAWETNYLMMAAIVGSRIFWISAPDQQHAGKFDASRWESTVKSLFPYRRHAWAARVIIRSYLKAARRVGVQGFRGKAIECLKSAFKLIEDNPAFDEGSDRERIVAVYAGLALLDSSKDWWTELKEKHAWANDRLKENGIDDPKSSWEMGG
jgi:tetratricopeptide (TPR) repeat protein